MPYIDIRVSKKVEEQTRDALQRDIAGSMELIPGKTAANTVICISDGYSIYKNTQPMEAAFIDVRLYKNSPAESKKAFTERIFNIIEATLHIPPSNVQINFVELPDWASNGNYF